MAKKIARRTVTKKPVKKQISRGEQRAITAKGYGKEPIEVRTEQERGAALSWYSSVCDSDQARNFLIEYLTVQDRRDEVRRLGRVADCWLPRTAAWNARMVTNGVDVPTTSIVFLERSIDTCLKKAKVDGREVDRERAARERTGAAISEIEKLLDEYVDFDVLAWHKLKGTKRDQAAVVAEYYTPALLEIIAALECTETQVVEGYQRYPTAWLTQRFELLEKIVSKSLEFVTKGSKTI